VSVLVRPFAHSYLIAALLALFTYNTRECELRTVFALTRLPGVPKGGCVDFAMARQILFYERAQAMVVNSAFAEITWLLLELVTAITMASELYDRTSCFVLWQNTPWTGCTC